MSGIKIDVEYRKGSEEYYARLRKLAPQLQEAAARAVNETADAVLEGLVPVIDESFEDPTDFTLDAFAATKARPGRSPSATVYMKDEQHSYLRHHIDGGVRRGGGRYDDLVGGVIVPGRGAVLDDHGNFPSGYLEFVEANGGWWMRTRAGHAGLFQRTPYGKVVAIAIATDGVVHKRRLVVDEPIEKIVADVLPGKLAEAIRDVLED